MLCTLLMLGLSAMSLVMSEGRPLEAARLKEASGLLVSTTYPGILWSHNDSGDAARLYALDATTLELVASVRVRGAKNVDWEDITYHNGQIVIGDFGDNANHRDDLTLYVIDEPNPYKDRRVSTTSSWTFEYDDRASAGDVQNFDCEAVFSFGGALYLLTKHRSDWDTTLYRLNGSVAQKIATYPIGGMVTAADSDGQRIAVLTYTAVYLFEPKESSNLFEGEVRVKQLGLLGQVEGIAFDGEEVLIISEGQNRRSGNLFTVPLSEFEPI